MKNKRFAAIVLAVVLAALTLAGCGRSVFSKVAAKEAVIIQGRTVVIEFKTANTIDNALRRAAEAGDAGDILADLLEELGYRDAVPFTVSGLASAHAGQHAVGVYAVTDARDASDAAKSAAAALYKVIQSLNGEYTGVVSMVKEGGVYYIAVDVTVVKTGGSGGGDSSGGDSGPAEEPTIAADITAIISNKEWAKQGISFDTNGNTQNDLTEAVNGGAADKDGISMAMGWGTDTIFFDDLGNNTALKENDCIVGVAIGESKEAVTDKVEEMLNNLPANNKYEADVGAVQKGEVFYTAVDVTVTDVKAPAIREVQWEDVDSDLKGDGYSVGKKFGTHLYYPGASWTQINKDNGYQEIPCNFDRSKGDFSWTKADETSLLSSSLKYAVERVANVTDSEKIEEGMGAKLKDTMQNEGYIFYGTIPDPDQQDTLQRLIGAANADKDNEVRVAYIAAFPIAGSYTDGNEAIKEGILNWNSNPVTQRFKKIIPYENPYESWLYDLMINTVWEELGYTASFIDGSAPPAMTYSVVRATENGKTTYVLAVQYVMPPIKITADESNL